MYMFKLFSKSNAVFSLAALSGRLWMLLLFPLSSLRKDIWSHILLHTQLSYSL